MFFLPVGQEQDQGITQPPIVVYNRIIINFVATAEFFLVLYNFFRGFIFSLIM